MDIKKFGFIEDVDNIKLKEIFKNKAKLKEIYIEIYPNNPLKSSSDYMLLLRTCETDVIVFNDNNRLVLRKSNFYNTYLINVLFSKIAECYYKMYSEDYSVFILNIQNIYYKITVFN